MGSLYPDILFHFTSKNSLFKILESTFNISYTREAIESNSGIKEFGVPMVSFCDLKLSELKEHMNKYGRYGIGMTKSWANSKGLNPVFYVSKYSNYTSEFITAIETFFVSLESIESYGYSYAADAYMKILNTYRYMKNYDGKLKRSNGAIIDNYRFADEREWRYVPQLNQTLYPFAPIDKIDTLKKKNELNSTVSTLKLDFIPDDIKYLIVEREDEIVELISHLDKVKLFFSEETRRRLASRILTAEQIKNDI